MPEGKPTFRPIPMRSTVWRPTTHWRALWGNVLEDVEAAASRGLALVNFGQIAQLRGHWAKRVRSAAGLGRLPVFPAQRA
jgi:hypothetical protein